MFLGASNNIMLLLILFVSLISPLIYIKSLKTDTLFTLGWIGFLTASLGSIILSGNQHLLTFIFWAMLWGVGPFLLAIRKDARTDTFNILSHVVVVSALLITLLLCFSAAVHLLGEWPKRQIFLYVDGFSNIRTYGETALLAWLIISGYLLLPQTKFSKIILILAVFICATLMFWSGTRAAWVGGMAALLVVSCATRQWKKPLLILCVTLLGLTASVLIPTPGHEYGAMRVNLLAQEATTALTTITETSQTQPDAPKKSTRLELWKWGLNTVNERPLTGHGPVALQIMEKPDTLNFAHLHNLVLDLAFWFGWPIGLLSLIAMLTGWAGLIKASWNRQETAPLYLMIGTGLPVTALFAGTLMFPITLVATLMALSIGIPLSKKGKITNAL
jgi:O-antigen ligase